MECGFHFIFMKFLFWNNNPLKQISVMNRRIKELRVDIVCLIETRVKGNNVTAVRKSGFRVGGALTTTMMLRMEDIMVFMEGLFWRLQRLLTQIRLSHA